MRWEKVNITERERKQEPVRERRGAPRVGDLQPHNRAIVDGEDEDMLQGVTPEENIGERNVEHDVNITVFSPVFIILNPEPEGKHDLDGDLLEGGGAREEGLDHQVGPLPPGSEEVVDVEVSVGEEAVRVRHVEGEVENRGRSVVEAPDHVHKGYELRKGKAAGVEDHVRDALLGCAKRRPSPSHSDEEGEAHVGRVVHQLEG